MPLREILGEVMIIDYTFLIHNPMLSIHHIIKEWMIDFNKIVIITLFMLVLSSTLACFSTSCLMSYFASSSQSLPTRSQMKG